MKIGLIIYGSIDTVTGGYLYDKLLVEHLRKNGHEVKIFSLPLQPYHKRILDNFTSLFSTVVRSKCDILLQDELCHPSLIHLNRMLQKKTTIPTVAIVHQVLCDEPRSNTANVLLSIVEKAYLNSVNGFICNSLTSLNTLQNLTNLQQPALIAPPGGDRFGIMLSDHEIRQRALQQGPLKMLFLGNVIPRKGLSQLIGALADCDRKQWLLEIVGSISMDKKYSLLIKSLIQKHHLIDNISFCGVINGTELAQKIARSQLLCMPYSYEGFGIVTLEAQSLGLPVIGSASGATPELVSDGINGYLVAPDDTARLSQIIADFYTYPEKMAKMGLAAKQAYNRHPTWSDSFQSIEEFLVELASNQLIAKMR